MGEGARTFSFGIIRVGPRERWEAESAGERLAERARAARAGRDRGTPGPMEHALARN